MRQRTISIAAAITLVVAIGAGVYAYRHSEFYVIKVATGPGDPFDRKMAIGDLYGRNDPDRVAPVLIGLLGDEAGTVRGSAAEHLGLMGAKSAVEPLLAGLPKQSGDERKEFATALGAIGDPRAILPLVGLLGAAKDREEALGMARAVAKLGPDIVPAVIPLLSSPKPPIRVAAASALGEMAQTLDALQKQALKPAVDALIPMLRDPLTDVKTAAADAIGYIRDPRCLPSLVAALGDRDDATREVVTRVIGYFGDAAIPPVTAAFRPADVQLRMGAAAALAQLNYVGDYDYAERSKPYVLAAASLLDEALARKDLVAAAGGFGYYLKQGRAEAVPVLIDAMNAYGYRRMVNGFLGSGEKTLEAAATAWATSHGFTVETSRFQSEYQWGKK